MIPSRFGGLPKLGVIIVIIVISNMMITVITIKDLVVIQSRFIRSRTAAGSLLSFVELCLFFFLNPSKEYENTTSSALSLRSC